jgi:superfamily I DNA/RNA helicase
MAWLPSFRELDHEQVEAVNQLLDKGGNLLYGPAGSGKTAITIFRAKTLADQKKSFILLVYTNALVKFLSAAAETLKLPAGCVHSFYKWVWAAYREALGRNPPDVEDKWNLVVDNLIAYWTRNRSAAPHYDAILVDEAQDFNPNVAKLLHMLTPNLIIAGDPAQSLYVETQDMNALAERWKPLSRCNVVARNYRNPTPTAQLAALFVDQPDTFLANVVGKNHATKPAWYEVDSWQETGEHIQKIVTGLRGEKRMGILVRHQKDAYRIQSALKKLGTNTQVALTRSQDVLDFNSTVPVITTVHSAKGLEFDWVVLPDLNAGEWDTLADEPSERHLFFVALTRTKERLYLISLKGYACKYLKEIEMRGAGLIQRLTPTPGTYSSTVSTVQNYNIPF